MRIREFALTSAFPLLVMAYGLYLVLQRQSFSDLAGMIMLLIGAVSLVLALTFRFFTRKRLKQWYVSILIGFLSSLVVFALLVIYARMQS